ncbi:MAG: ferritin, partial [Candidatus Korarchaeota archaeon NZ13-K]
SGRMKEIAVEEMKHAEAIAERLWYLGGTPTTVPDPIKVGSNLREMIEQDVRDEEEHHDFFKTVLEGL